MASEWHAETHEDPDVRTPRILWLVLGFLGCVALLFGILGLYYRSILQGHSLGVGFREFPAPQLQQNPTQDYANFRAAQMRQLTLSGPVGGQSNLIRTTIDEAMAMVVARGAQAYDPVPGAPLAALTEDGAPRAAPNPNVAPYGMRQ